MVYYWNTDSGTNTVNDIGSGTASTWLESTNTCVPTCIEEVRPKPPIPKAPLVILSRASVPILKPVMNRRLCTNRVPTINWRKSG
jgi:hypothetical protein